MKKTVRYGRHYVGKPLTPKELEALWWKAQGLVAKEIAVRLGRSIKTVEKHMQAALDKSGAHTDAGAVWHYRKLLEEMSQSNTQQAERSNTLYGKSYTDASTSDTGGDQQGSRPHFAAAARGTKVPAAL